MVNVWHAPPKPAANLVMGVLSTKLNELKTDDVSRITVSPESSTRLLAMIEAGKISATLAKDVWLKAFDTGKTPEEIIADEGLAQIDDEGQIVALIDDVIAKNADAVAKYRGGNAGTFGFLVGQVMKAAAGKANPKRVNELLKRALGA
jgi:aspartyl-tRNA(Asn)/glutamyl-tRNA(Gln) amidotransferase subunit B